MKALASISIAAGIVFTFVALLYGLVALDQRFPGSLPWILGFMGFVVIAVTVHNNID